jgi:hypothetical protein
VPVGLEHEGDVVLQPALGVVVAGAAEEGEEGGGEAKVERVLPGRQELVVVDAALAPEAGLLAEDVALGTR